MLEAFGLGLLEASSLLLAGLLACWLDVPARLVGLVGVAVFLVADKMVETRFGQAGVGGTMGIVVGSVVDGVPESIIFGIQVGTGFPISLSFLAAVFISNSPQSIAPSADLSASGWSAKRLGRSGSGSSSHAPPLRLSAIWPRTSRPTLMVGERLPSPRAAFLPC